MALGTDIAGYAPETGTGEALRVAFHGIYEISKIISARDSATPPDRGWREVVNLLSSFFGFRRAMISLAEPEDRVRVVAASCATRESLKRGEVKLVAELIDQILASGMPVVIHDLAADPRFARYLEGAPILDGEAVSFFGAPIRAGTETVGALTVERVREASVPPSVQTDLRLVTLVANMVGQRVSPPGVTPLPAEDGINPTLKDVAPVDCDAIAYRHDDIVGLSPSMQRVFADIQQVAPTRTTVLLRGDSGTGKEVIARAIHELSERQEHPFVKVNCAALAENLLESELFGHDKGAYTGANSDRKGRFELANGGTLFLDEIGDISPAFQTKLLRVVQEGEFERVGGAKTIKVDVRLIAATNRDLETAVANGQFRADLYYRINVVPIFLPPLRERREDIPHLVAHFLRRFNSENRRRVRFSPEALRVITTECEFPGNVRELENCINRSSTMVRGEVVQESDLPCRKNQCFTRLLWPRHDKAAPASPANGGPANGGVPLPPDLPAIGPPVLGDSGGLTATDPRERLIEAMEKTGWVQAKAARLLGLTPRQIGYALRKHNIAMKHL